MNITRIVASAMLFSLYLSPAALTAQEPAGPSSAVKAPAPAAGRATREVDEWTAQFTSQTKKVEELQKRIEQDVPRAMDAASTNIERALTEYLKDPSDDNRLGLQKVTEDELRQFVDSLKPIVGQRKVLETAVAELEKRLRDRAAGHQGDSFKLNSQLPVLKMALAKTQAENSELKKRLAAKPTDANLDRELRKRFRDEQRQENTLLTVERKSQFKAMAAKQLQKKAEQMNLLLGETEATLDNIENTVEMAQSSADDLFAMRELDLELRAVGGERLDATLKNLADTRNKSRDISAVVRQAWDALKPDEGEAPAPPRVADEDYAKWLAR
jgi:hypothetical protein